MNKKVLLVVSLLSVFANACFTSTGMEQKDSVIRTVSPKKPFPVNRIRTARNYGTLGRTPQKTLVNLARGKQLKQKAKNLPSGKKKQRTNKKAFIALTYVQENASDPVTRVKAAIELDRVKARKKKKKKQPVDNLSLDFSNITIRKKEKSKKESPNKFAHLLENPNITVRKKQNK